MTPALAALAFALSMYLWICSLFDTDRICKLERRLDLLEQGGGYPPIPKPIPPPPPRKESR